MRAGSNKLAPAAMGNTVRALISGLGLRPLLTAAAAMASALVLTGCLVEVDGERMTIEELNEPGVKPALFVEGNQLIGEEDSMLARLDGELLQHFNIIFVVNKGTKGEFAQTMTVLRANVPGCGGCGWTASDVWDVSTGREQKEERDYTTTPVGIYQLDPQRFHREFQTTLWNNADMPHSMFWRYEVDGEPSGWAMHAANEGVLKKLGSRASGGCIRLHPTNAEAIFNELLADHRGRVPRFDWSEHSGEPLRNEDGRMHFTAGIKALLVVDNGEDLRYESSAMPSEGFESPS